MTELARLPQVPALVADANGEPNFGAFTGALSTMGLDALTGRYRLGRLRRKITQKKWTFVFIANPEVAAMYSIVDLGYAATAFSHVVDLRAKRALADTAFLGVPSHCQVSERGAEGLEARFTGGGNRMSTLRPPGETRYLLDIHVDGKRPSEKLTMQAQLQTPANGAPLTVIAPVEGGLVNVTQKWAGLTGAGAILLDGETRSLDGAVGGLDVTNGYLARHVQWKWGFCCGRLDDGTTLGLNLTQGLFDAKSPLIENAVWVGDELTPLPEANFSFDRANLMREWKVTCRDGVADLRFEPISPHNEMRNLIVAKSGFVQIIGLWSGTLKLGSRTLTFSGLPGVAEDQDVVW